MNAAAQSQDPVSVFPNLKWAHDYLKSSEWVSVPRYRQKTGDPNAGSYPDKVLYSGGRGITAWFECHPVSPTGEGPLHDCDTLNVVAYGPDMTGFPGIAHGGVVMTILDDATGHGMSVRENVRKKARWSDEDISQLASLPEGIFVTAGMNIKFIRPLPPQGSCGVKVRIIEETERSLKQEAIMFDENEKVVAKAESVWTRLRRPGAKI